MDFELLLSLVKRCQALLGSKLNDWSGMYTNELIYVRNATHVYIGYYSEAVESNLRFLGLIIFENKLKPGTAPAIATLRMAHIPTRMVTGDNIRTAISVGRECGMISQTCRTFLPTFLKGQFQRFARGAISTYRIICRQSIWSKICHRMDWCRRRNEETGFLFAQSEVFLLISCCMLI